MIQRIQSVFLLLVIILAVLYLLFPLGSFTMNASQSNIILAGTNLAPENHLGEHTEWYRSVLSVLPLLVILFTVYIVLQYKRRIYQIRLCKINIMIHLVILVISFFYLDQIKGELPQMSFSYGPSIFFPLVSLILLLRANRSILRDEKLVRAADRIR